MQKLNKKIPQLDAMKKYPSSLYYKGDETLLERPMVSIVGSRKLSQYAKEKTYQLSRGLADRGMLVVSGAAMGADSMAHKGAGAKHTIAVVANGLDIRYPAINQGLIEAIEKEGLVLSQFEEGFRATKWSFVVRNELVVALSEALVIVEAGVDSGSMRSAAFALAMGKPIYVLPHLLGESEGTQALLEKGEAKCIYNIEAFLNGFGTAKSNMKQDDFYYFCQKIPTFDSAVKAFGNRVYEAELEGFIAVEEGKVRVL